MHVCGIILSGGKSSRMGTNKSLLKIDNKPVIRKIATKLQKCTDELIISANDQKQYHFLQLQQIADRYTDKGPLAGIEAVMHYVSADIYIISAADTPFINEEIYCYLLNQLGEHDAVVPIYNQFNHPLSGIYKRTVLPKIQSQLKQNKLRINSFFDLVDVNYVDSFNDISESILAKHFFNMNHPHEYEEAKTL